MPDQTLNLSVTAGGATVDNQVVASPDSVTQQDLTVADSVTDQLVTIAIDFSELESIYLYSSATVTVETNSSSAPDDTITLTAGVPIVWYTSCGHANLFSADVTAFYITNASGSSASINIRVAQDSTP